MSQNHIFIYIGILIQIIDDTNFVNMGIIGTSTIIINQRPVCGSIIAYEIRKSTKKEQLRLKLATKDIVLFIKGMKHNTIHCIVK